METANVDCLLGTTTPEGKERGRVAVSGTGRAMKRFVFVWIWLLLVFFFKMGKTWHIYTEKGLMGRLQERERSKDGGGA